MFAKGLLSALTQRRTRVYTWVIPIAGALAFTATSVQAKLLLGFDAGYGVYTPSNGLAQKEGKPTNAAASQVGATSGATDLSAGQSAFRDMSTAYKGYDLGVTLGAMGHHIGVDVRLDWMRYTGTLNRYSVSSAGALTITGGDINFSALKADVGVRLYPKEWVYLRPHFGRIYNAEYKFDMKTAPNDSASENTRTEYGASLMFVLGKGKLRWELGADYTAFSSQFGGSKNKELAAHLAPTLYLF